MKENYIKLLNRRIENLDSDDFDLEAWKGGTVSVIERVFGENDPRIRKINDLKIDYSSWALRDATSTYNPTETCKKKGKEILNTLIEEIDLLGVIKEKPSTGEVLKKSLSDKANKRISELIKASDAEALLKLLKAEKKDDLASALRDVLLSKN